jgi:acetyl esterase/lipase
MNKPLSVIVCLAFLAAFAVGASAQSGNGSYNTVKDIPYIAVSDTSAYRAERCRLDIYYPEAAPEDGFSTVVWFHGGGLEGGSKYIPQEFKDKGIAVVAVNYRLYPRSKNPDYTVDAAEAVAWVVRNIAGYGGNPHKIYVSGHSAGGYLALMLALDKRYLGSFGVDADSIAAYLPVSGQTVTHFTIRKERGLPDGIPIVDEFAPVNCARANTAPIILLTGDRRYEMASRWEENVLLESVLRNLGNKNVTLYEMQGFNHSSVASPACLYIAGYITQQSK